MPVILPLDPDLPSQRYRIALSGVEYFVRLTYRDRTDAWYLDLYDAAREPVIFGRRLSPGWSPLLGFGAGRKPPGVFIVESGPEPKRPTLLYFERDELPALPTSDLRVVLP